MSGRLGDGTGYSYCGQRQFRIVSAGHENFLSYNEQSYSLTLLSVDEDDVGSTEITLEAYLVDYPEVSTRASFYATVTTCRIVELVPPEVPKQVYEIDNEAQTFSFDMFIKVPKCEVAVVYSAQLSPRNESGPFTDLPTWLQLVENVFTIQTEDFDLLGMYKIQVFATV